MRSKWLIVGFITALFIIAGSNHAYGVIIFEQNFEDYSIFSNKYKPSHFGWQGATSALSIVSTPDPSDPAYGDYSMNYTDSSSGGYSPYHPFPAQTGLLKVSMDLRKDWGNGNYMIYITQGASYNGASIYMGARNTSSDPTTKNSVFSYFDGALHEFGTFSYDVWYHIDLLIDIPSNTYDIYVDNVLRVDNANFRGKGSVTSLDQIKFGYTSWGTLSGYIDNIEISVVPEPATFLFLTSGLAGLLVVRRKYNKRQGV